MITVLMLNNNKGREDLSEKLKLGYEDVYNYFSDRGIMLCRAPISFYDINRKMFKNAQFFNGKKWLWKKDIIPSLVYDKSRFYIDKDKMKIRGKIEKDFLFFNPP